MPCGTDGGTEPVGEVGSHLEALLLLYFRQSLGALTAWTSLQLALTVPAGIDGGTVHSGVDGSLLVAL